ncbi:7-cyano-7-deazaguanine synthase [Nitrosophilus alvini]|uniref:7-cyano-7-deazaguanine synthase n=1 Tax=Nitrosophilus alvini TaxID=2714855 RepID=UPI00190E2535|nr:7-cyano-7-deazaguanine synthase [Nitrosophilus alvini]
MRALALFSGGLDSLLAMKLIIEQGIEVIALHFETGFGGAKDAYEKQENLRKLTDKIGAKLEIVDVRDEYIQKVLFDPKYGYGKNFNPCIDCHAHMVRVAKALLEKLDAKFIISGEVLGQRPMSQRMDALKIVSEFSDADGLILRPLSAKLLPPTIPETEGWVDREKLLDISGRSRERQMELAKKWGIEDYPSPSGGCLLTDEYFSEKIRDFIKYDTFEVEDIPILKVGRHFRLPDGAKLVIARNKEENEKIAAIENPKFVKISLPGIVGPLSLLSKSAGKKDRELAASLALTYSKADKSKEHEVLVGDEKITARPLPSKEDAKQYFLQV